MNIFRLAGDLSHLFAIIILIVKMWKSRSVAGWNIECLSSNTLTQPQMALRDLWKGPDPLCPRVHDALPGSVHQLRLHLQLLHESPPPFAPAG